MRAAILALAAEAAAKGDLGAAAKAACAASSERAEVFAVWQPSRAGFADARAHPIGAALAASHSRRDSLDLDLRAFRQFGDCHR